MPIEEEINFERCLTIHNEYVVKRELKEDELARDRFGAVLFYPYWRRERLRNEAATLHFIASNTSIPVPHFKLYTKDGLLHLETARITNGILLKEVGHDAKAAAIEAVEDQMQSTILPQLRSLRRNHIGSVDAGLPVFPPQRVYKRDRRTWPRISSTTEHFVFCHNDLGPQNIFIDPITFQVVAIIDWEFAGFFPSYFELPLWREREWNDGVKMYEDGRPKALAFFGIQAEDLQNHSKITMPTEMTKGKVSSP